jgi:ubiquinone/menaquinone biosynthesis C-methylase UbiE
MWNDALGYEAYVGHWSRAVAPRFLAWLALPTGLRWLDVACGTGALTSAILARCGPEEVVGLDASAHYLAAAQGSCQGPRARFVVGDANVLSFPSTSFDVSVSGLALNFIAFDRALAEQHRVVRSGGTIAAYVWDYAGEYEFARRFTGHLDSASGFGYFAAKDSSRTVRRPGDEDSPSTVRLVRFALPVQTVDATLA